MTDAPHPWTYHDPGETDAEPRITDDNGDEITLGRAWREVQRLRGELSYLDIALSSHVVDNAHRLGALGAGDVRDARRAVDRALA